MYIITEVMVVQTPAWIEQSHDPRNKRPESFRRTTPEMPNRDRGVSDLFPEAAQVTRLEKTPERPASAKGVADSVHRYLKIEL